MKNPKNQEKTYFEAPSHIKGLTIRVSHFHQPAFKKHFHPFYSIGIIESGEGSVLLNKEEFKLFKKSSIFINPQEVHACNPLKDSNWSFKMFYIENDLIKQTVSLTQSSFSDLPLFKSKKSFDIKDFKLIQNLYHIISSNESKLAQETALFFSLAKFLNLTIKEKFNEKKDEKLVQTIKDYLQANYQKKISLEKLSALTNKSIYYMCRTFSAATGLPPHSYQNQLQVEKAKKLLTHHNKSLSDVALEVGFYDQAHFSKKFKAFTGISPKKYKTLI